MEQNLGPLCYGCRRFTGVAPGKGFVCGAYPDGVPVEILASLWDHRKPQANDHGLRYQPMPATSESQRRAMFAAAAGHSTLGIPAKVGKEFTESDPGGHLPARAKDMAGSKWGMLKRLFVEWINEEEAEPEHEGHDEIRHDPANGQFTGSGAESGKGTHPHEETRQAVLREHQKTFSAGQHGNSSYYRGAIYKHSPVLREAKAKTEQAEKTAREARVSPESDLEPRVAALIDAAREAKKSEQKLYREVAKHAIPPDRLKEALKGLDEEPWERKGRAASVAFTTQDGRVLLLKRAKDEDNWPDTWSFPGGQADGDESDEDCARREAVEECGDCGFDGMSELERTRTPNDFEHVTYVVPVKDEFEPKLNAAEHQAWGWHPVTDLPDPIHPGVRTAIDRVISGDESEGTRRQHEGALSERTREHIGRVNSSQREGLPESDFLLPSEKKYPVRKDGKYDRGLLLAAAREARMHGHADLAERADKIREREFGSAQDVAIDWDTVAEHAILAYDKSARSLDTDGRLHVDEANICQGKIDEYYGEEINGAMGGEPGWQMLDPKRKYKVFRDPKELAKPETVKSANGIPILGTHVPTDAKDHKFDETIGSTGTTARFEHPFIKNGLNFWPQKAIDGIDDGSKEQLSPGYRYRIDLTPGTFEGEPFDMIMRDIRFNHLAQVPQGRQGKQVVVPDADPDWRDWATLERAILDMGRRAA